MNSFKCLAITCIVFFTIIPTYAQSSRSNDKMKDGDAEQEILSKSVIRGRVFYEDTGFPIRRGRIGLFKIPDLSKTNEVTITESLRGEDFVLTNDNGEFEIRDVKVGKYYPFVKVQNVISPESVNEFYERSSNVSIPALDNYFQPIIVDGISEIQVLIPVKRGGSVSGKVLYEDGSPAIDVKVEILRKGIERAEEKFVAVGEVLTDDRGFYRFTQLLSGQYKIKVVEPSTQEGKKIESFSIFSTSQLKHFIRKFLKLLMLNL